MSKPLIILLSLILAFIIFSCKSEQKAESEMQKQEKVTTVEPDTGQATCPICGMTMAKADMIAHELDGETFYFCSEHCKSQYLAQRQEMEESEDEDAGIEDE